MRRVGRSEQAREDLRRRVRAALDDVLIETDIPGLPPPVRGKVRDNYDLPDGRRLIVATDRQSAFDRVLAAVPFKGQVLTATARFWFAATADICRNHVLAFPDPNVTVARRLRMLPVEVVVRDYLAGTTATSIWPMYRAGRRSPLRYPLPDGLRENEKLPETIVTPTTKGEDGAHDEPVTAQQTLERGLLAAAEWEELRALALALFARGRERAAANGLILVDTKYEFGLDEEGRITLADEIPHPRFPAATGSPPLTPSGSPAARIRKRSTRTSCAAGSARAATPTPSRSRRSRRRRWSSSACVTSRSTRW